MSIKSPKISNCRSTDIVCDLLPHHVTPNLAQPSFRKEVTKRVPNMTSLQLFDFDREVEPVLEVLVGKTIEQSLEEVMEEEELARLKAQQRAFEELRNNELAEVQRLQEQERRRREEKVRGLEKVKGSPSLVKCANPQETAIKKKRKKSLRQMAPYPRTKGCFKEPHECHRVFIFTPVTPFCVEMVL